MNTKIFWDCNRFTTRHNFSVIYTTETGETTVETYSCDATDLNSVVEYLARLTASSVADEIMVLQHNYNYLQPWFNMLRTYLVGKNYNYAEHLTYKGVEENEPLFD